ncbi:lef-6 protein [Thysanoplusia orichalcea nucleopolyhedrovirus]|uniref:Lef-6 protein n=1 Tax=Thysanoplusia orichalcea nucleopolyhedrovirus TaxID=101850 RepID=L0CJV7_9ABAC|nr:lef-6 protein [Thysanoplusia orichalcea nucleopolyhedrovirus]AGA16182.1 lef-6 protein [Thysanoplusia orichalcea nucleopolyhedrovirus]
MTFNVYYNGYYVEKKFSKEFLIHIAPDLKNNVDWNGSTRKHLRVLDKRAYKQLLSCDRQYFWPNGTKFVSRPYNRPNRTHSAPLKRADSTHRLKSQVVDKRPRRSDSPYHRKDDGYVLASSPIPRSDWNEELKLYAETHGYDDELEEGEIEERDSLESLNDHLNNLNVLKK